MAILGCLRLSVLSSSKFHGWFFGLLLLTSTLLLKESRSVLQNFHHNLPVNVWTIDIDVEANRSGPFSVHDKPREDFTAYDGEESMSACLLICDDNHRLTEWIAYHYFSMPLRYLVIAVDPGSHQSPTFFLDQWRDRMTILEWTDSDFSERNFTRSQIDSRHVLNQKHLDRQCTFYKS
jgi:hypothetical protein